MRIDLKVPYEEKDAAKKLGARWDGARRVWYLIDPQNLLPFARWLHVDMSALRRLDSRPKKAKQPKQHKSRPVATPHTDFSLPACGCTHAPPWEICCDVVAQAHAGIEQLDPGQREHMRSILSS